MTTRYNAYADQAQPAETMGVDPSSHNEPTIRVCNGAIGMTAGGEVKQSGPARHSVSFEGTPGGSILSSLQKSTGQPSVELEPGNPMSRTSVEAAIRMGALERDAAGNLREVGTTTGNEQKDAAQGGDQAAQGQEKGPNSDVPFFDAEDDALWQEDIGPLTQPGYEAAVASGIGAIARGDDIEKTVRGLVQNEGIEPELAREYVQEGIAKEQRTVDKLMASIGIEGDSLDECYEQMRQQPAKLQDALQRLVYGRDLSGFRTFGLEWQARQARTAKDAK
jgi:hypothetical protein